MKTQIVACLLCDTDVGNASSRKCSKIFEDVVGTSDVKIASVLVDYIGINVAESNVHSEVICRKCVRLCEEVLELEERLSAIKLQCATNYLQTLKSRRVNALAVDTNEEQDELDADETVTLPKRKRGRPRKQVVVVKEETMLVEEDEEKDDEDSSLEDLIEIETVKMSEVSESSCDNMINEMIIELENQDSPGSCQVLPITNDNSSSEADDDFKLLSMMESSTNENNKFYLIPQLIVSRENNLYKCLLCPVKENFTAAKKSIMKHIKDSHDIVLYICSKCDAEFVDKEEFSKHSKMHAEDHLTCKICTVKFENTEEFKNHQKMHYIQSKTCGTCGKVCRNESKLKEHEIIHTAEKPFVCKVCNKAFHLKYALSHHEKTHQERERSFSCVNCGKSFFTEQHLIHHERIHSGIKKYICSTCGKSFNTANLLACHFVEHTGYKPLICRLCGKSYKTDEELQQHVKDHSGEKPYRCEFCGSCFRQRSELQAHKRTSHYDDRRYKCIDCGKGFKRRRLLDYHMKSAHTGERPLKCSVCDHSFIYPEHFKKHLLIHTGEKPYECEVCGKAFNSRDNRNAHRYVHSDKKPYECAVCGAGFMRKPQLFAHMRSANHTHEAIIVNQPRLGLDDAADDQFQLDMITQLQPVDEPIQMTIITDEHGNQKFIQTQPETARATESGSQYYVEEVKNESDFQIILENGQRIGFDTNGENATYTTNENELTLELDEKIQTEIVDASSYYSSSESNENENVQIVQIRLEDGDDSDSEPKHWYKIIQTPAQNIVEHE